MIKQLRPSLVTLIGFTVLTGIAYPLVVTGIAQSLWPHQANGSIIMRGSQAVGSELLGQQFTAPGYFWSRPSAASPPYNGIGASGSNLAASNPVLADTVKARVAALHALDPGNTLPAPVDLVTASASGLDPHISPAAAEFQVARVARARHMSEAAVQNLVQRYTQPRDLGILGEPRVNVLDLNLALDAATR